MENQVKHLGVIMDGNRRWARQNKLKSVLQGHSAGSERLIDVCDWCVELGIPYLTVYAFSTENYRRSADEVNGLFKLMDDFFTKKRDYCVQQGVRINIIGNRELLTPSALDTIERAEAYTAGCNRLQLNVALSYGGRDELIRAIQKYTADVQAGKADPAALTEEQFNSYLDTFDCPDIDLVIRTGGNQRLSNFMPWQTVYSEIVFDPVLWPDFDRAHLQKALEYYRDVQINNGK